MRLVNIEGMTNFEVKTTDGKEYVLLPFKHLYDIPTVPAIPLDKVKQVREEIAKYQSIHDSYCEHIAKGDYWEGHTPNHYESSGGKATACDYFLQVLDKLIESEEK